MAKRKLAPQPFLYPKPAVLVGAVIKGRPNFMTIANLGIVRHHPPLVAVASPRSNYTNSGIKRAKTFSVNIASAKMAAIVDYCGLHSGREVDQSRLFEVFYLAIWPHLFFEKDNFNRGSTQRGRAAAGAKDSTADERG